MHQAVAGSHGTRQSRDRSGTTKMSRKPCSKPEMTLWRRSIVMIASVRPMPLSTLWWISSIGTSLPRQTPCSSV